MLIAAMVSGVPATASASPESSKSPVAAGALSFGVTLGGFALIGIADGFGLGGGRAWLTGHESVSGGQRTAAESAGWIGIAAVVVGPTLGHAYAGHTWNRGLKIRLVGVGIAVGLAAAAIASDSEGAWFILGYGAYVGGGATYAFGSLYEMFTAPGAASAHNRRAAERRVVMMPVIGPRTAGLTLGGSF